MASVLGAGSPILSRDMYYKLSENFGAENIPKEYGEFWREYMTTWLSCTGGVCECERGCIDRSTKPITTNEEKSVISIEADALEQVTNDRYILKCQKWQNITCTDNHRTTERIERSRVVHK